MAQEVASCGIGVTLVELGGARTEFRHGNAQVAPALDPTAASLWTTSEGWRNPAIIATVDQEPAPMRIVLGSAALRSVRSVLAARPMAYGAPEELAASTDVPTGE